MQVHTDPVVLRIAVEEHSELQQWIGTVLYPRDHAARRECGLL